MNKMNLFFKSIGYSVKLVYKSSGIMLLIYFLLNILGSTLGLFETYALKYILDNLSATSPQIDLILLWIGLYAASLVIVQANTSLYTIIYDSIIKKAEHMYECNLANKLAELPLSIIDSSEGKDMVDDVRYSKNTAVYTTYRMVRVLIWSWES